jgi:hypothetical protein
MIDVMDVPPSPLLGTHRYIHLPSTILQQPPLWRIGAEFRAACVCGLWVLLAWFPASSLPRAAAQLLMVSVGVSTAWVQTQHGLLDRLASGRFSALRMTAGHLRLARFAQTYSHFFGDEAIDGLFAERWQSPRPRQRRRLSPGPR